MGHGSWLGVCVIILVQKRARSSDTMMFPPDHDEKLILLERRT